MHGPGAPHPADDRCDPASLALLRAQSPGARLLALDAMWRSAAELVRCGVKDQHPDWSEPMVSAETARRMARRSGSETRG